jgi:hypothetical protein
MPFAHTPQPQNCWQSRPEAETLKFKKKNRTCLFAGPISIRYFVMFPHIWRPASELLHLGGYRHDEFGKLFRHVVGFVGFGVSPLNLIFLQTVP